VKPQKTRDVIKHLRSLGWVYLRDAQGSHELWGLPDGSVKASIPAGHREVSAGVLKQIKDAGADLPESWR
jgi:predicted RNA binding protein YcfA (HicA-like mRNA interferase family)